MSSRRRGTAAILAVLWLMLVMAPAVASAEVRSGASVADVVGFWSGRLTSYVQSILSAPWTRGGTSEHRRGAHPSPKDGRGLGSDPWGRPIAPGGTVPNPPQVPTAGELSGG